MFICKLGNVEIKLAPRSVYDLSIIASAIMNVTEIDGVVNIILMLVSLLAC